MIRICKYPVIPLPDNAKRPDFQPTLRNILHYAKVEDKSDDFDIMPRDCVLVDCINVSKTDGFWRIQVFILGSHVHEYVYHEKSDKFYLPVSFQKCVIVYKELAVDLDKDIESLICDHEHCLLKYSLF